MAESALIVRVPEAEPHVAHWRSRFDPAAGQGVPAHITVLFPFVPPDAIDADVLASVCSAIADARPFAFRLASIERFPGVVYLAPDPSAPFVELTNRIVRRFPAHLPYGGQFDAVVPHLTVAHASGDDAAEVEAGLRKSLAGSGVIESTCTALVLIENSSGLWRPLHELALASEPASIASHRSTSMSGSKRDLTEPVGDRDIASTNMSASKNNPVDAAADREIVNTRIISAPRALVFRAWSEPDHLARWWGPKGFTNTFHAFDMRPGGTWKFTMHAPNGGNFENEIRFVEIVKLERIVLDHVSPPRFQVTATFADVGGKTRLEFRQRFATAAERDKIAKFAVEANEQNLDRLEAELARMA
jgi:uncharacterized protein YndB with AHSA1/START domain/2'-5' RNA ligase